MVSYSLIDNYDDICNGITNSYVINGFVENPLIAGMIVTFITLSIVLLINSNDITKIFVIASFINTIFLLFHAHALKKKITDNTGGAELKREFDSITTNIEGTEGDFVPPKD